MIKIKYIQMLTIFSILFSGVVGSAPLTNSEKELDDLILSERSSQIISSTSTAENKTVDSIVDNVQKRFAKLAEALSKYQIKAESAKKAADLAARKAEVRAEQTGIELSRAQTLLAQLLQQETVSIKFDEGEGIDNIVSDTQKEISRLTVKLQKERIKIEREIKAHKAEANRIQLDIEQARAEKKRVQELLNQLSISRSGGNKSSTVGSSQLLSRGANILQQGGSGNPLVFLDDVLFATNLASLNYDGAMTIQMVADYLLENPQYEVLITGHADYRGGSPYNLNLSQRRAEAVSQELLNKGIEQKRFVVHSYGEQRPKLEGSHQAALQQNRRVEINILK
jgi:outer membrane protein OmpA-like peptidoglycan-associated protein